VSPRRDRAPRPLLVALAFGLAALPAGGARAQLGHGLPPPTRPLHLRLAQADVVAIAEVERVDLGRVAVHGAQVLRGTAGERFEIKRSVAAAGARRGRPRALPAEGRPPAVRAGRRAA
jgi:hypothetical protein